MEKNVLEEIEARRQNEVIDPPLDLTPEPETVDFVPQSEVMEAFASELVGD